MSEEKSDVPKELLESVRDAVGRKVKLTLKKKVKLEVKGDKLENRILALASHRAFLLTARVPSKVEQTFNYLDIQGITGNKPNQLVLEHDRGQLSLKLSSTEDVDEVLAHIGCCLQSICPGLNPVKVMRKLVLKPVERVASLQAQWEDQAAADPGPCGGFSQMYGCVCDQMGLPYREEVQWDVDTIYLTQDTRELNLQDFVHLDSRDLVAIIAVLEYNQWFTKLSTKDYKLSTDVCEQILRVVARSSRLEELVLENAGLRSDFAQKLASALSQNPSSALHTLNLGNNSLEDKGMASLSVPLGKLQSGLKHVNLSKTSLSSKGVNSLAQSLSNNPSVSSSLTHLDLSGNALRGDDLPNLCHFLGQPNSLQTLDLSHSDCPLDLVCSSLLRGSLKHLSILNLSKSVFSHRKGKDIPPSFKQFFNSALALSNINLSGTKLPLEALKALLLGLGSNPNLKEVSLDLSSCELRSAGSQILEGCIAEIPNISSLDISDNGLDSDLTTLLVWLSKNRSIRHLSLGKNFNNIKSKNLRQVLGNLVHVIQEEESPLMSLSLADSKLKAELSIVLNALGSNTSLTRLDISGNGMGDMGAKMLAKALQINTKLRTIVWDKNNISPQGLQDVAAALEKNYTIRFMPMPIIDAAQALKASPEKTEDALLKMEQYLLRNHETRKYLQEQAYRLQQGIVTTTTQQMIDGMCVKVQDHLNSLRFTEADAVQVDMRAAENLMKDARNSKTLLPNMYYLRSTASRGGEVGEDPCVGPIQDKLESMAGELTRVLDEQLQSLLLSMVDTAEALCPHVMKKASLRQELIRTSAGKMAVPRGFVTATLLEQSAVDIINKISEVKLGMASFLSDRIVDEILESLSHSQHTLAEHLSRKVQPLQHQDSQETEVLDETDLQPEAQGPAYEEEERMDTCTMTPKFKRKSILCRMLRPVSVAFEMEFDLDKALEEVPIHVEDPPLPPPPTPLERLPSVSFGDLPPPPLPLEKKTVFGDLPSEVHQLQHITKLRPKRNKKSRPSRAPPTNRALTQEAEQNGHVGKLDEGIEEFFKKVTKPGMKRSSQKSGAPQEGEKKRDSRMSGFFNLIKPRSSKSEKSHGPAAATPPAAAPPAAAPAETARPASPKAAVSSPGLAPVPEPVGARPPEPSGGGDPDPPEEPAATSDPKGEPQPEGESRDSPLMGRHIGVQVMGNDFLAEMRAKQERRAAAAHGTSESSSSPEKADVTEEGVGEEDSGSPETKAQRDPRPPEPAPRTHPPPPTLAKPCSGTPRPPPLPQSAKHPLSPLTSGPLSPRPGRGTDESPESPSGNSSPKAPLPSQRHKRAPSDTEQEGQSGPLPERGGESPATGELTGDGGPFDWEQDSDRPLAAGKHWTSLRSATNPAEEADQRQRTKSLPTPVRPLTTPDTAHCPSLSTHASANITPNAEDEPADSENSTPELPSPDPGDQTNEDIIPV